MPNASMEIQRRIREGLSLPTQETEFSTMDIQKRIKEGLTPQEEKEYSTMDIQRKIKEGIQEVVLEITTEDVKQIQGEMRGIPSALQPMIETQPTITTEKIPEAYLEGTQKLIDIIVNTPQVGNYLVAELVDTMFDKEDDDLGSALGRLWDALTLKKRTTFLQLLDKYTPHWPKPLRLALGTALDIVADPLTYLGGIGLTKFGKNIKALESALSAGADVAKLPKNLQKTYKALRRLGYTDDAIRRGLSFSELGKIGGAGLLRLEVPFTSANYPIIKGKKAFEVMDFLGNKLLNEWGFWYSQLWSTAPGYGTTKKITQTAFDYKRAARAQLGELLNELSLDYRKVLNWAKRQGKSTDEVWEMIYKHFQKGTELPEELTPVAKRLKNLADFLYQVDKKIGVEYKPLNNYIVHMLAPEVRNALGIKAGTRKAYQFKIDREIHKRIFRTQTPQEINRLWRETDVLDDIFPELAKQKDKFPKLFEENPVIAMFQRAIPTIEAKKTHDMLKEVAQYGIKEPAPGFAKLNEGFLNTIPDKELRKQLSQLYFPERAVQHLQKFIIISQDQKELQKALRYINDVTRFFKRNMLASFAWNARNAFGLAWQMFLNDINPKRLMEALWLQKLARQGKAKDFVIRVGDYIYNGEQILKNAKDWSVMGTGLYGGVTEATLRGTKAWPEKISLYAEPFFKINAAMEDTTRLAAYLQELRKGFSPKDAARNVLHMFGDTRALTDFERRYVANVIPFYGWYKYSIPFQLKKAIEQPGKFANLSKLWRNIEQYHGVPPVYKLLLPDWALSAGAILTEEKETEEGKVAQYVPRKGYDMSWDLVEAAATFLTPFAGEESPTRTLGRELPRPMAFIYEKSHPLIKNAVQLLGFNVDSFGAAYDPNEEENFLGVWLPKKIVNILSTIRILRDLDTLNPGGVFGEEGKPSVFGYPPLGRPETLTPGQRAIKAFLGMRTYETNLPESYRRLTKQLEAETGEGYYYGEPGLLKQRELLVREARRMAEEEGLDAGEVAEILNLLWDYGDAQAKKWASFEEAVLKSQQNKIDEAKAEFRRAMAYKRRQDLIREKLERKREKLQYLKDVAEKYDILSSTSGQESLPWLK